MDENLLFNQKLNEIGGGEILEGISLRGENIEKILDFINANTSHEYIINNGFLEMVEDNEIKNTLLDEEILQAIQERRKIAIALNEELEQEVEKFISENNPFERIILLKRSVFVKENLNDEALADRLTKALFKYNSGIALLSSTAIKAVIAHNSNVYHGPDSSNYAKVGSIDQGEDPVYILATSMGWYHIEYVVTSTGKHKTGYIPADVVSSYSGGTLTEEDFYGGYCYATTELDVRTCDVFNLTAPVGTLFQNEGCTFLFSYEVNGKNIAFIEYATSSGTKRGYVYAQYLNFPRETIVCIANEKLPVYATPNFSESAQLGSIYQNELMGLLAKEGNVIYVEYNTTKGRKRGYVDWTKVNPRDYTAGTIFSDFYVLPEFSTYHVGDEVVPVYGGPSTSYAQIGSVNCENVTCFCTNNDTYEPLTCIEYVVSSTGLLKRGYVAVDKISEGTLTMDNLQIEEFSSDDYFTKVIYGQTQLERDMCYLKTGTGNKHIFLVFGLHGWEDGKNANGTYKHGDGNILLKIAKNFISRFASMNSTDRQTILNNWTIFLFPGINLDGMANGYTNNGFGRCLYNGIDPNRSWPGNFQEFATPRNKTGSTYLGADELVYLKNCLMGNASDNDENILIDIHGWENSFITNNENISKHFLPKLQELSSACKKKTLGVASGFLATWAQNPKVMSTTESDMPGLAASTALLEFPPTTDYSDNTISSYGEKLFNGTIDLLLEKSTATASNGKNDELYVKLQELYELAENWNDSDSILENNKLVLDYLRYENYSAHASTLKAAFDVICASTPKDKFYEYVQKNMVEDLSLNEIKVYISSIQDYISLEHWALTTLTLINQTDSYARDLAGWAGDLVTLLAKCQEKYDADNSRDYTVSQIAQLVGCTDIHAQALGFSDANATLFDREDFYQDIDAINLFDEMAGNPIHTVLRNYYDNGGDGNRKNEFIQRQLAETDYISFESGLTNEEKLKIIAKQYTAKEIDYPLLTTFFQVGWGNWDEERWGDKGAEGFASKVVNI